MEVLHGNQAGSKHSRRHSDRYALAENRLLDWASHDSDIALQPHSPLALANIFTENGGVLNLLPREATLTQEHPAGRVEDTPDSTDSLEQRANLLTEHSNADLLSQCKKILVENALIKMKGERQLYLAAGFVEWPKASDSERYQKAPILLFPAILVRVTGEQRYEVRLTGDTPEFNSSLKQYIEQRHDCVIPQFDPESRLVDFFSQVTESLQDASSVELDFTIALGSAAVVSNTANSQSVKLPEIPNHFDMALAMSITGNKRLEHLTAVLQLIPDFKHSVEQENKGDTSANNTSANSAARLRRYAAKLAAEGLDHVEFRQLPGLPTLIGKWNEHMALAAESQTLRAVMNMPDPSARELIKLAGIIELIDKAPENIDTRAHGDLCFASSTVLLRRAQHQAKLIEEELSVLQEHFHLDNVPSKSQLLSLITELGCVAMNEPDLIGADYFNARRQFLEFSKDKPANITLEHRRHLSQLAKVMRFRELFVNNIEYRTALGRDYKGLRTDWPSLFQTSDYARELASVLGSEGMAAAIINNWLAFRDNFTRELENLQQAADATRRLLSVVGKRWQTHSLASLSAHATMIAKRIEEWNEQYGSVESHADKSAEIVLSSFSGPYMDHVLVETQVDETQSRIRQQLSDGEIDLVQVNDTLSWLSLASAAASEHDLGIEAIVEHLQSA